MADILFCTAYILLFSFIILRSAFFKLPGFKNIHTLLVFYLKLVFGVLLWYIYAHHYKNRITSDIFKYYDDSQIIFNTIHTNVGDFFRMLTGIGDNTHSIQELYKQMNSWANSYQSAFYNNSHFIIRLNVLFRFLSGGHYGVHVIFMCFISLLGLVYLYKAFYPYLTERHKGLFVAIFLFPSVLLWGSGILKEGIIFLGLGMSIYFFEKLLQEQNNKSKNILLTLLGLVFIFEAKAYVLLCILPCFISEYAIKKITFSGKHPGLTYFLVTGLYLGTGLNIGMINIRYSPLEMLATKQQDFNRITRGGIYLVAKGDTNIYAYMPVEDSSAILSASDYSDSLLRKHGVQYLASTSFTYMEQSHPDKIAWFTLQHGTSYARIKLLTKDTLHLVAHDSTEYRIDIYDEPAKSRINISPIQPTITSLVSNIPKALAISVLRPFPSEIHSSMVLIYFFENVFVLLLLMVCVVFMNKKNLGKRMVGFCFIYCLLMLVLIGLVTPLYGGIERYKCVVMPFLLILLLLIYDKDKIKRALKR